MSIGTDSFRVEEKVSEEVADTDIEPERFSHLAEREIMKTPAGIAKRFVHSTTLDAEPEISWFVSRERASLVGWAVTRLYATDKGTPVQVLKDALADVDFSEDFVTTAASTKPPFLTLDNQERRYFAYLCNVIRESVTFDMWTGDGREERWKGPNLEALNEQIEELVAQLKPLLRQREALLK